MRARLFLKCNYAFAVFNLLIKDFKPIIFKVQKFYDIIHLQNLLSLIGIRHTNDRKRDKKRATLKSAVLLLVLFDFALAP